MCPGGGSAEGQRLQLQGHPISQLPSYLILLPPSCRCCLSATSSPCRPPKRTKQAGEEKPARPAPTLVGCILMASDWIGCALNSLLGHQKEGREESLIHQTEILIDFQPAGVGHEAPTMEKEGDSQEKVGTRLRRRGAKAGQGCVAGCGKRKFS